MNMSYSDKVHINRILKDPLLVSAYARPEGSHRIKFPEFFIGTPENIASYLFRNNDAKQITIFDVADQIVAEFSCGVLKGCDNRKLMPRLSRQFSLMQKGAVKPTIFDLCTLSEIKREHRDKDAVTCYFRMDDDDYTKWIVNLPSALIAQIKSANPILSDNPEELLTKIPKYSNLTSLPFGLIEAQEEGYAMYVAEWNHRLYTDYHNDGLSVTGCAKFLLYEENEDDRETTICLSDLVPEMQERLIRIFGKEEFERESVTQITAPYFEGGLFV